MRDLEKELRQLRNSFGRVPESEEEKITARIIELKKLLGYDKPKPSSDYHPFYACE